MSDDIHPDEVARMDKAYREGASLRELSRAHNMPHTRIRRALLSYGTPMRLPGFLNTSRDVQIHQLHGKGYSLSQIGGVLGISRQRVHQVIHRNKGKTNATNPTS